MFRQSTSTWMGIAVLGWVVIAPWACCDELAADATESSAQASAESVSDTAEPSDLAVTDRLVASAPAGVVLASAATTVPTSSPDSLTNLRQLLEQIGGELSVDRLPRIEELRGELEQATTALEKYIKIGTDNGDNWSQFLRLSELREQLASERPNYPRLLDLEMNMRQNYLGLEYPQFVRVREALRQYAYATRFHRQEENYIRFLNQSIDEALRGLDQAQRLDGELGVHVGLVAVNLFQANQAPEILHQLRGLYASPNVRFLARQEIVNRLVGQEINQPQNVDECILGTRVLGQAHMHGNVSAQLLPRSQGIGVQLDLAACMSSRSRGYNRGVVVNTSSLSPVLASMQIFLNEGTLSTSSARVSTNLQTTIHSIEHRLNLVRKIASRKAAQQKPQADAIAEHRLQSRIQEQFSQRVHEQMAEARKQLDSVQRGRSVMQRVGLDRPQLAYHSTRADIQGSVLQAAAYQLAAPTDCPLPVATEAVLVGQIHQSAVTNALDTVLAGRVLRSKELGAFAKQISGKISDELQEEIKGEEWSITFNPYQPVRIELDDQLIRITLRLVRMTREAETLNEALSITTAYLPSFDGSVLTLSRQGEVSVTSDRQTQGVRATAMRSFIKSKFDKTFRESIVTEPLDLSQTPRLNDLKLDFQRLEFLIDDGWLQVTLP